MSTSHKVTLNTFYYCIIGPDSFSTVFCIIIRKYTVEHRYVGITRRNQNVLTRLLSSVWTIRTTGVTYCKIQSVLELVSSKREKCSLDHKSAYVLMYWVTLWKESKIGTLELYDKNRRKKQKKCLDTTIMYFCYIQQ